MAMPGELEPPGCGPAPVGTFMLPRFGPGTAFGGFGCFGWKALFSFFGGTGFLLNFSRVLNSGTFFRSGGTISSCLGCGGCGFISLLQRLFEGSTTLLSLSDGVLGMGSPLFGTRLTFTALSLPPPGPAHWLPAQWKYAESATSTINPPCRIPETVMYGVKRISSVLAMTGLETTLAISPYLRLRSVSGSVTILILLMPDCRRASMTDANTPKGTFSSQRRKTASCGFFSCACTFGPRSCMFTALLPR